MGIKGGTELGSNTNTVAVKSGLVMLGSRVCSTAWLRLYSYELCNSVKHLARRQRGTCQ